MGGRQGKERRKKKKTQWKQAAHKKHNRQSWTVTSRSDRNDIYEKKDARGQTDTQEDGDGVIWTRSEADCVFQSHKADLHSSAAPSHHRAKKQTPLKTWLSHSAIRQRFSALTTNGSSAVLSPHRSHLYKTGL